MRFGYKKTIPGWGISRKCPTGFQESGWVAVNDFLNCKSSDLLSREFKCRGQVFHNLEAIFERKLLSHMTTTDQINQLKFPIGPFAAKDTLTDSDLNELIDTIEAAPAKYRHIARGLSDTDLRKSYREGACNVQQLLNHVADMHLLHF